MKLLDIKDIDYIESPVFYRREYTGLALFEMVDNKSKEIRINFTLESQSIGPPLVNVEFTDNVDYPLLPLIRLLKSYVMKLDQSGELPK